MQEYDEIFDFFESNCCENPIIIETRGSYTCKNCGMVLNSNIIYNDQI